MSARVFACQRTDASRAMHHAPCTIDSVPEGSHPAMVRHSRRENGSGRGLMVGLSCTGNSARKVLTHLWHLGKMTLLVFLPRDFRKENLNLWHTFFSFAVHASLQQPKASITAISISTTITITVPTLPSSPHFHHTPVIVYLNISPEGFHTRGRFFSCPHDMIFEVSWVRLVLLMGIINTVSLLPHIEMESFLTLSSLTVINLRFLFCFRYPAHTNKMMGNMTGERILIKNFGIQ